MQKLVLPLVIFISCTAFAQKSGMPALTTPIPFAGYGFLNGKSIYSHADLLEEGTFLFPQEATLSTVKLKNGSIYTKIKSMINFLDNELIFQDSNGQNYTAVTPIDLVEFEKSNDHPTNVIFKTGFPSIDGFTEDTFYEVLSDGKSTLLKARKITYVDRTSFNSSAPIRQYYTNETFYIYNNVSGMQNISKSKKNMAEIFNDKNEEVAAYLANHKVDTKSGTGLADLFVYYNSLFSSSSH